VVEVVDFVFITTVLLAGAAALVLLVTFITRGTQGAGLPPPDLAGFAAAAFAYFLLAPFIANMISKSLLWLPVFGPAAASVGGSLFGAGLASLLADEFGNLVSSRVAAAADQAPSPQLPAVIAADEAQAAAAGPSPTAGAITTAFDNAGAVQTWWDARKNTKLTDAQITALGNAERLAMAAARAAEAEAKGITAAIRRADGLTELYMRQILEEAFRNDQVAVAQQKLVLAQLRREKER
jgi:hypothetical protein